VLDVDIVSYITSKIDEPDGACEDALGIASEYVGGNLRFAVADGASMSAFSGIWASMLVQSFVNEPFLDHEELTRRLPKLAALWHDEVYRPTRPWHAVARASRGAFSAFIGVELRANDAPTWTALAIGDCSMFIFREGELQSSLPFSRSAEFPDRPALCSSLLSAAPIPVTIKSGALRSGDTIVLASDAFSRMLFDFIEGGRVTVESLIAGLSEASHIRDVVKLCRREATLQNDDVAVVVVRVR
jgi:serine/threonine protein phosphatase PrpC